MEKEINLSLVTKVIKKNLLFLFIFNSVILTLVVWYSFIMPETYSANVKIMPSTENSSGGGLSSLLNNFGGGGMILGGSGGGSQVAAIDETLKSRTLNLALIEKLRLDTLKQFNGIPKNDLSDIINLMTENEVELNGFIIYNSSVSTGPSPDSTEKREAAKLSALLANTAVDILDSLFIARNTSSAKLSRIYVEKQLKIYKKELDSIARAMELFQTENNILAIDKQTEAIVSQAISIYSDIATIETELNLTKIEYSKNSKQVKVLEKQLSELKKQAREVQAGGIEKNSFSIALDSVPKYARIYAELFRDRKVLEQVILYLETQKHEEAIQENRELPIISILDRAIVPDKKSAPSRSRMLVAGATISIFVSLLILFTFVYIRKDKY